MAEEQHPDQERYGARVKTLIYSRIVGYMRPLDSWNTAKQHEFHDRKVYSVPTNEQLKEETGDNKVQN